MYNSIFKHIIVKLRLLLMPMAVRYLKSTILKIFDTKLRKKEYVYLDTYYQGFAFNAFACFFVSSYE